jgi:hypothetical protein
MITEFPMSQDLQAWFVANKPAENLIYGKGLATQVMFVRDELQQLVGQDLKFTAFQKMYIARVISTHTSKSVKLPVYLLQRPDLGLHLILRDNYHDWKLSVISDNPISEDFSGLFHTTPPIEPEYTGNELAPCYFDGFPEGTTFGYYESGDKRQWSAMLGSDYAVYMTVFLIMRALGVVKPKVWHTRKSHAEELARDRTER